MFHCITFDTSPDEDKHPVGGPFDQILCNLSSIEHQGVLHFFPAGDES